MSFVPCDWVTDLALFVDRQTLLLESPCVSHLATPVGTVYVGLFIDCGSFEKLHRPASLASS